MTDLLIGKVALVSLAEDNFNRSENPLSTNGWATASGFNAMLADGSAATAAVTSSDCISVSTFNHPRDQFSAVVIGAIGNDGGLVMRGSTSVVQGYLCDINVTGDTSWLKITAGPTFTAMGAQSVAAGFVAGDEALCLAIGDNPTYLHVFKNGIYLPGLSRSDDSSPHTTGKPSIHCFTTNMTYTSWRGGGVIVSALKGFEYPKPAFAQALLVGGLN